MFVNKRTVLNQNCVSVHVRWIEKSGNQILFNWLIESDSPPWSFPGASKKILQTKPRRVTRCLIEILEGVHEAMVTDEINVLTTRGK